jgi:hypothetical protein
MKMKALLIFTTFLMSLSTLAAEPELKPLFNGADFTNLTEPKKNIWWSIKDKVIICKNGPKKKGSTLYTSKSYKNFIIQLDFKMGEGTVDSGVFLRNNDQIQIGISGSLKRDMTGSPYIPKKGYPKEAEGVKELLKVKDWNTMKIKAVGPVYTIWLNGTKVNEYTSKTAKEAGPIGFQLHPGRIMEIHFRNISIAELD